MIWSVDAESRMEDVDLAFRGQLAGWMCLYIPEARVRHFHGGTAGFGSDLSVLLREQERSLVSGQGLFHKASRDALPWIVGAKPRRHPLLRPPGQVRTALRAKVDGLKGIHLMLGKRKKVVRKVSEREICKHIRTWSKIGEP